MTADNLLLRARKLISAKYKIELANFNSFPPVPLNHSYLHLGKSKEISSIDYNIDELSRSSIPTSLSLSVITSENSSNIFDFLIRLCQIV